MKTSAAIRGLSSKASAARTPTGTGLEVIPQAELQDAPAPGADDPARVDVPGAGRADHGVRVPPVAVVQKVEALNQDLDALLLRQHDALRERDVMVAQVRIPQRRVGARDTAEGEVGRVGERFRVEPPLGSRIPHVGVRARDCIDPQVGNRFRPCC